MDARTDSWLVLQSKGQKLCGNEATFDENDKENWYANKKAPLPAPTYIGVRYSLCAVSQCRLMLIVDRP